MFFQKILIFLEKNAFKNILQQFFRIFLWNCFQENYKIYIIIQAAGNAVKRATDALVNAAQEAKDNSEEANVLTINRRMVGGMAQVILYFIGYYFTYIQ